MGLLGNELLGKSPLKVVLGIKELSDKIISGAEKLEHCGDISTCKDNHTSVVGYGVSHNGTHIIFAIRGSKIYGVYSYCDPYGFRWENKKAFTCIQSGMNPRFLSLHRRAEKVIISPKTLKQKGVNTQDFFAKVVERDAEIRGVNAVSMDRWTKKKKEKAKKEMERYNEYVKTTKKSVNKNGAGLL